MDRKLIILCILAGHALALSSDYSEVQNRLYTSLIPTDPSEVYNQANGYANSLNSEGFWPDINYTDPNRAVWPAAAHVTRLQTMVLAYVTPGQPLFNSTKFLSKITLALNYWLDHDFQNPNWWYNQIGIPLMMGEIGFFLRLHNTLDQSQLDVVLRILTRANPAGWTGANYVWMENVQLYKGFITSNETAVKAALAGAFDQMFVSPGNQDGIKPDGTFYQHGPQLYNGGYGLDFVDLLLPFINITTNTSFFLNTDEMAAFSTLMLDGDQWMLFFYGWDYVALGRQITRPANNRANIDPEAVLQVAAIPGPRSGEWKAFGERLQKMNGMTGNKHFWMSDYMVHHRETYGASVRMYSNRTYNSECVNSEGLRSVHMADGVFNIYQTGMEYEEIFPVWDWDRVPGITCALGEVPNECDTLKVFGKTNFVGGASDGLYGAATFDFKAALSGTLSARKSWFFLDDQIVALGTNITSRDRYPIVTTLNQCKLNGDVYVKANGNVTQLPTGNHTLTNVEYIVHDGVGYLFLETNLHSIGVSNMVQTGTWQSIGQFSGDVSMPVFSAWINQKNDGDTYAYSVIPGTSLQKLQNVGGSFADTVTVLQNTPSCQAISLSASGDQIVQAVFWETGTIDSPIRLTASSPCIALVSSDSKIVNVTIADPTQSLTKVQIGLGMATVGSANCVAAQSGTAITFDLPQGQLAGSSKTVSCTLKT